MKKFFSFTIMLVALLLCGCGQNVSREEASASMAEEEVAVSSEMTDQPAEAEETGRCVFFYDYKDGEKQLNVYQEPSTSSPVVATLKNESVDDAYIYITPCENKDWYHVSKSATGPYIGYIRWERAFLDGELAEGICDCTVTDPDGNVNVRQFASTKSQIVKTLPKGHHFIGYDVKDNDQWMGVLERRVGEDKLERSHLIGFVHISKITYTDPQNEE